MALVFQIKEQKKTCLGLHNNLNEAVDFNSDGHRGLHVIMLNVVAYNSMTWKLPLILILHHIT
jgi:hypothetical protein